MRIIGGAWRSRRVRFAPGSEVRPTPDRVRETLFNWLGQDVTGLACLDLFAGSGALGFEAASRGAASVVMVERDRATHAALVANRERLGADRVEVVRGDALEFLHADRRHYDVIFLDPPFSASYGDQLFDAVAARMAAGACVYYEAPAAPVWPAGWRLLKQGRAGQVVFQLAQRPSS